MGAFLDKPIMEKTSEDGVDNESGLKYALCCMQGWRVEMEDAHSATLTITDLPGWSFFAVFDGHAGSLVAERSSKQLLTAILSTAEFKKVIAEISTNKPAQFIPSREQMVEIEKGIKNGFLTMDKWLFDVRKYFLLITIISFHHIHFKYSYPKQKWLTTEVVQHVYVVSSTRARSSLPT